MENLLGRRSKNLWPLKSESESHSVMSDSLWPHGYIVHGLLQARILEWVAFPFSRGSSQPRDRTQVSLIASGFFTCWASREAVNLYFSIKVCQAEVQDWVIGREWLFLPNAVTKGCIQKKGPPWLADTHHLLSPSSPITPSECGLWTTAASLVGLLEMQAPRLTWLRICTFTRSLAAHTP